MADYSNYSEEELRRMKNNNDRCLSDPYEQDKWVEREQNAEIERELRKRES